MKRLAIHLVLIAGLSFSGSLLSHAVVVISVNFQGANTVALAPGDVTGAVAAANWYNAVSAPGANSAYSGPAITLSDSTGTATGVQLTAYKNGLDGPEGGLTDNSTTQSILFGGGLNAHFGGGTFTITGLSGFSSYDIIAYYYGGQFFPTSNNGQFTASGSALTYYAAGMNNSNTSFQRSNSTTAGSFAVGNYVQFQGLTDPTETITFGNTNNRETLIGFQVIGTAVPEPATWAMLLVGGMLLTLRPRAGRAQV